MASLTEWQTLDPSRVERGRDSDGPDRVIREWRGVLRDDGVAISGSGESLYPDAQGVQDGRQRIGTAGQARGDLMVEHSRETSATAIGLSCIPHGFCSVARFLGQLARDMDVSVTFSNNQIHEARTREDREYLEVQMEQDSPWIVVYRSPSHTQHPWRLGRREVRFRQREEIEAQLQWLISSVRQRLAKGYLVLVEGTWFDEQGVLSELSGVADSVTGESFEVLREVSPQLDAAWSTASARMKMVLEAESQHQLPVAEEMEQEELDQFKLPGMTDAEQLRKKEWLQIPRQARKALRRLHHTLGHKPKAVMRQVLKAGGASPEQLAGVELFHCDKCDEAVLSLRFASREGTSKVHVQPRGPDRRS